MIRLIRTEQLCIYVFIRGRFCCVKPRPHQQPATGVLRPLDHVCGTRCRLIYGCVTVFNSLNGFSRPICLVFETAALCDA